MNYIDAVREAKRTGCKIKRAGWDEAFISVNEHDYLSIGGVSVRGGIFSVEGVLATDWEVIPGSLKTMSFADAMQALQKGKIIGRVSKPEITFWLDADREEILWGSLSITKGPKVYSFHYDDVAATDWYEVYNHEAKDNKSDTSAENCIDGWSTTPPTKEGAYYVYRPAERFTYEIVDVVGIGNHLMVNSFNECSEWLTEYCKEVKGALWWKPVFDPQLPVEQPTRKEEKEEND